MWENCFKKGDRGQEKQKKPSDPQASKKAKEKIISTLNASHSAVPPQI
jgi:hypothetical protein